MHITLMLSICFYPFPLSILVNKVLCYVSSASLLLFQAPVCSLWILFAKNTSLSFCAACMQHGGLPVIMLPFTKLQPCVCSQAMAKADAQQSSLLERVGRQRGLHPLLRHLMREDPYATHQQLKQVVLQYAGVNSTTEFTVQYEPGFTGRRFADSPLLCNLIKKVWHDHLHASPDILLRWLLWLSMARKLCLSGCKVHLGRHLDMHLEIQTGILTVISTGLLMGILTGLVTCVLTGMSTGYPCLFLKVCVAGQGAVSKKHPGQGRSGGQDPS